MWMWLGHKQLWKSASCWASLPVMKREPSGHERTQTGAYWRGVHSLRAQERHDISSPPKREILQRIELLQVSFKSHCRCLGRKTIGLRSTREALRPLFKRVWPWQSWSECCWDVLACLFLPTNSFKGGNAPWEVRSHFWAKMTGVLGEHVSQRTKKL